MKPVTQNTYEPTRRSFVKGAAVIAGAAAALGFAGCAPQSERQSSVSGDDVAWDEEFDVVVVGAGASGLAAAVTVATESDASCVLVEKGGAPSGSTPFSNGLVNYTDAEHEADYAAYLRELVGEASSIPDDVLAAYAHEAASLYDWAVGLGANPDEMSHFPVGQIMPEWPEFEHALSYGNFGIGRNAEVEVQGPHHVMEFLQGVVEDHADRIDYRTNAAMERLVQDPANGAILGIVVDGKAIRARRGVVMCCGGFEHDAAMLEDYYGMPYAVSASGVGNTGDGHRAAAQVGAGFWRMGATDGFWMAPRNKENTAFTTPAGSRVTTKNLGITVGRSGRRFYMDFDSFWTMTPASLAGAPLETTVGVRHGRMQIGGEWPRMNMPSQAWFVFDADALAAGAVPETALSNASVEDLCYQAGTLEELAGQIGVPQDELVRTVEAWNGFCDEGFDAAFYRPTETLTRIATPPFYAQLCAPAFLTTNGGPARNASEQVLDVEGEPIVGLYAAGEFGSAGCNLSEALCTGRLAGRSAASATEG